MMIQETRDPNRDVHGSTWVVEKDKIAWVNWEHEGQERVEEEGEEGRGAEENVELNKNKKKKEKKKEMDLKKWSHLILSLPPIYPLSPISPLLPRCSQQGFPRTEQN